MKMKLSELCKRLGVELPEKRSRIMTLGMLSPTTGEYAACADSFNDALKEVSNIKIDPYKLVDERKLRKLISRYFMDIVIVGKCKLIEIGGQQKTFKQLEKENEMIEWLKSHIAQALTKDLTWLIGGKDET